MKRLTAILAILALVVCTAFASDDDDPTKGGVIIDPPTRHGASVGDQGDVIIDDGNHDNDHSSDRHGDIVPPVNVGDDPDKAVDDYNRCIKIVSDDHVSGAVRQKAKRHADIICSDINEQMTRRTQAAGYFARTGDDGAMRRQLNELSGWIRAVGKAKDLRNVSTWYHDNRKVLDELVKNKTTVAWLWEKDEGGVSNKERLQELVGDYAQFQTDSSGKSWTLVDLRDTVIDHGKRLDKLEGKGPAKAEVDNQQGSANVPETAEPSWFEQYWWIIPIALILLVVGYFGVRYFIAPAKPAPGGAPAPTITDATPDTTIPAGGTSHTVTGTNYKHGTDVYLRAAGGGAAISVLNVVIGSPTAITFEAPPLTVGSYDLVVMNPDGQYAVTSFTVA